ncbi:hypothetical protein RF55_12211 [Lasius niger]|uniref:Reverse transcriptase domain-containing protein n=1 Tax=Lasius niger TaxID=67767 RepID=A0A0J7KD99_LASNI|nr:hypothetical protein RF55_12211 [Lasius niger]
MGERKEEDREGWERELREELRKDMITGIKTLGEGIREDLRGIKDGLARQGEGIKEELEKIKEEFGERERKWEEERREIRERIENLERKVERLIKKRKGKVGEGGKDGTGILRGREERIDDDLTWEERKVRWKLRETAREEEGEGRRVRMGNGGLQIDVIADLEEEIARGKWGGVKLGEKKIFSMAYADDIVLLAEKDDEMSAMLARTERYINNKKLEVNVMKTKIMVFRKGGRRRKRVKWMWKGKKIEEVKEIKYLSYVFQSNGRQDGHVRDRIRKAVGIMGRVWSIGKRKFGKDIRKRTWLFDALFWMVLSYGAEIWGWKERAKVEKVEERFLKWLLGVDRRTPGYMVREELKRDKLRSRAARRAWNFEIRLEKGKGGRLAKDCLEEIKKRTEKGR